MANLDTFQTSFEFGELSERLISRIDLPAYRKGLKTQENCYSWLHGGATKRRGTLFHGEVYDSAQRAKLIPFYYDDDRRILLVLNGGKIQFFKDGAWVESSPGVRYSLNIPYAESELAALKYCQTGANVYFAHGAHHPKMLTRITDTSWTFSDVQFIHRAVSDVTFSNGFVTFRIVNGTSPFVKDQQFTITTTGGAVTSFTATPTGGTGTLGNGQLAAVASMPGSTTSETWTIKCVFATAVRQEWSVTGSVSGASKVYWKTNSYPKAVCAYEQRLFFGGSPQFPQHIWGSVAGDFLDFSVGNRDSDGIAIQLVNSDYNSVVHLFSGRTLMPMTTTTEFSVAGSNGSSLSGLSSNVARGHTSHGSSNVRPLKIGQEIIFVERSGLKLRAISYSVTEDANIAPDLTILAEHLSRAGTFTDMAFAESPDYITWVVRSDGALLSLTRNRDLDATTAAWARHTTDGRFENVATLRSTEGMTDVFLVVKRTINGTSKRFLEQFDYDEVDVVYADSSIYYDGAPVSVVTGLDHLVGKEVAVLADGAVHGRRLVNEDGEISLDRPASTVIAGLPFTMTIELLNPEFGDLNGSSQGRKVKVNEIVARFQDTVAAKINDRDVTFRTTTDGFDVIEPYTGDKRLNEIGWRSPHNIKISSDTPNNVTVLGVIIEATVN